MERPNRLLSVENPDDIPPALRGTPLERFLQYHNLNQPFDQTYSSAQLLVGMCMDNRKHLRIPDNFAYIIRSGGANLRYADFKVSYAIGVGGVRAIALMGHTNCGMCGLLSKRDRFIQGMVENAGWDEQRALEHFNNFAPMFEIGNEIDFVVEEAARLNRRYPKVAVLPLIYKVEDNRIYLIKGAEVPVGI